MALPDIGTIPDDLLKKALRRADVDLEDAKTDPVMAARMWSALDDIARMYSTHIDPRKYGFPFLSSKQRLEMHELLKKQS